MDVAALANASYDALVRSWAENPPSPNAVFAWNRGQYVAGFIAGYNAAKEEAPSNS